MPHFTADETANLDVAIIGAGWYGLTCAATILKLEPGYKVAVFDKYETVGGTWSKDRIYPNLVAQVEFGYFNYPSKPMPTAGKPTNNLVSGDMVWKYLNKFADDNDLKRHIRFSSWVSSVERNPAGGWKLTVNGQTIYAAKVICAAGITTQTNKPGFEITDNAIPVIHAVDIAKNVVNFEKKENDHFVLLGAAKSAIIRDNGSGPMPIMPSKLLGKNTITVGSNRLMNYLSPSLMTTDTWLGSFFHRTMIGRWLTRSSWGFITSQADNAAGFGGNAGKVEGLKPELEDNSCFWCESSLGLITMEDFWSTLKKGDIRIVRDQVSRADESGVTLKKTAERINADFVIYATGWGDHFSFFSPELKNELGLPLYDGPAPVKPAAKEYPFGFPAGDPWSSHDKAADDILAQKIPLLAAGPKDYNSWKREAGRKMTARRWRLRPPYLSCNLYGPLPSLWAVAYLLGEVNLPSEEDMVKEIAEWNAWTRRRYGAVGERYPYALFDWIVYLDRLLKDLGVKSQRNGNALVDFFKPYGPQSYHGVIEEYMAVRPQKVEASPL
ncbi:Flavin-binding monooxygenase-like family protein [Beauveria bassiana ARSEF 2860]|uniref:Flavin-binding monooxygenase-like family protein n=1 Tax=Beauveria bassiana (strain ARSEF 2860) TaxID=655819 RepID=J4UJ67_BEAB2|nr:Flavin-binding monooxygenase-like family protein [Beauveria bassiana ARSEF 2860]EJP63777.1 Flavin-binding monooxygenase-like family protein [Beauveria bassiana ARSEF 2860]